MSADRPKDILGHYETWLIRHQKETELVPKVQRARDAAEWQYKAWTNVQISLPAETRSELEAKYDQEYQNLRTNLPLPTEYPASASSAVVTGVTTSTMSTYFGILSARDVGALDEHEAAGHLDSYASMLDAQNRIETLRTWLTELFPRLIDQFDKAVQTRLAARSQPEQIFAAALASRTLLERFKGQLMERARSHRGEKMPWVTMAERLVPATERQMFREQETQHSRLFDRLSKIAKNQHDATVEELESLWPLVVDHLYVICAAIREPT